MTISTEEFLASVKIVFDKRTELINTLKSKQDKSSFVKIPMDAYETEMYDTMKEQDTITNFLKEYYVGIVKFPNKPMDINKSMDTRGTIDTLTSIYTCPILVYLKLPQIENEQMLKNTVTTQVQNKIYLDQSETDFKVINGFARFLDDGSDINSYFCNSQHINIAKPGELESILIAKSTDTTMDKFITELFSFSKEHIYNFFNTVIKKIFRPC